MKRFTEKLEDGRNILRQGILDICKIDFERFICGEAIDKLTEYENLEDQNRILKLPCKVGDYALFSNGDILPVVYITLGTDGITVGCQNGINISMTLQYGSWCKGFYASYKQAENAKLKR